MNETDWQKINDFFHRSLELDEAEREEFLHKNVANTDIRREVMSLLESERDKGFLKESVIPTVLESFSGSQNFVGERFGAYQIIGELGRGGMGAVYQGMRIDGAFELRVAIKILPRSVVSEYLAARFQRERQILANLNHPYISKLFDGGAMDDGTPYFVMELVRGNPITSFCYEQNLSVDERLRLFLKVCEAVEYAHKNGIVHRDLKPSNILVTTDETPKLLDFGIAKFLSGESNETINGLSFLTPEYASPEQIRGGQLSQSSDVYSLGVLLYEMLTAQKPFDFENRSPLEIATIVCDDEPEKPSTAIYRQRQTVENDTDANIEAGKIYETSRLLRGDLDNIVLKSMRKEPARRYSSVTELAADIENYRTNLPVKARPNSHFYRTGKFVSRNRAATLLAALLMLSITVLALTNLLPKQTAKVYPASSIPVDEAVRLSSLPVTEEYLQFSADGKNVFFVSNHQLYTVGIDGKNLSALKTEQQTLRLVESHDGKQYAFATEDGLFVTDKNFSNPKKIAGCSGGRFSWSPDNQKIVTNCAKDNKINIFLNDIAGKTEQQLTDEQFCSDASFAPDGKRIAFTCESDGKTEGNLEIYTMGIDGSNRTRLTNEAATDRLPVWSPDGTHLAFTSNRAGNDAIYVMHDDGSDLWRATFSPSSNDEPAWSSDGKFIAFRSDRDGSVEAYLLNVEPKILAEQNADEIEPAFSPDGKEVVFSGNRHGKSQIFRRGVNGENLRQITWGDSGNGFPRYSPDGSKIAFSSNRDGIDELYLMNPDGTNQVRLTDTDTPNLRPSWSFDGKQLVFVKTIEENKEIYKLDLFSGKETRLTFDKKNDDFPAWTPDGKIVFFSDRSGKNEVYQMNADGSNVINLSNNPANDGQMTASKDGKIVFTSNRTRVMELWFMNADGSNQTQLTFTAPDGFNSRPQFSFDGKQIIYNSNENDREFIRVVNLP